MISIRHFPDNPGYDSSPGLHAVNRPELQRLRPTVLASRLPGLPSAAIRAPGRDDEAPLTPRERSR